MTERALDANVFIHAVDLNLQFDDAITVPEVVEELEGQDAGERYELSSVDVYQPGQGNVERVVEEAENKGEELSRADVQLLALALEREAVVVTDDYGVQNVASALGVEYEQFRQEGIEEEIQWKKVCESCGAEIKGERCGRCGGGPRRVSR